MPGRGDGGESIIRVSVADGVGRLNALFVASGRPALLLAGLLAAGLALRALPPGAGGLAHPGQGAGTFVLVAALACAVGAPRQAAAFAAGYAFGFWEGAGLAWLASALACIGNFAWARAVGREWVKRRLRGRLARLDRFLAAQPFTATLTLRLLPVGNNLVVNLAAGVSAIAAGPFLAASVIGYLPQTAIFALLGEGVQVARATRIAIGVALFAASAISGAMLLRQLRRTASGSDAPAAPACRHVLMKPAAGRLPDR